MSLHAQPRDSSSRGCAKHVLADYFLNTLWAFSPCRTICAGALRAVAGLLAHPGQKSNRSGLVSGGGLARCRSQRPYGKPTSS